MQAVPPPRRWPDRLIAWPKLAGHPTDATSMTPRVVAEFFARAAAKTSALPVAIGSIRTVTNAKPSAILRRMAMTWNDHYAHGFIPWDTAEPDSLLVQLVESRSLPMGKALDVGCGTGTHALWLAGRGYSVLGIDIAPLAIELARSKMHADLPCRFENTDILAAQPDGGPFDLVFDRGCFHVFDAREDRARLACQVAKLLAPGGVWLSLIGSTEGHPRDAGPPRRSLRDVADAIEPHLEIMSVRSAEFRESPEPTTAWICLSRLRSVAAQPSSRHRS